MMDEFDEGLWIAKMDTATVHSEHEITFNFKDGLELNWKILHKIKPQEWLKSRPCGCFFVWV